MILKKIRYSMAIVVVPALIGQSARTVKDLSHTLNS
jgi:hypothetical protein